MKRVLIVAVLVLALMLALVACGQKAAVEEASVPAQEEETASVANPWREVTQEEYDYWKAQYAQARALWDGE